MSQQEAKQVEPRMMTVAESAALPPDVALNILKEAKGGSWYDGWKPYCMTMTSRHRCAVSLSTLQRMEQTEYGFRCSHCGNMIGWDLYRLQESPLNKLDSK